MKTKNNLSPAPATESIKYAGSKLKLLPYIIGLINEIKPDTVLDGFSGTTRVAQALAQSGYRVIANDRAIWSEVLGTCYLQARRPSSKYYADLIAHLNQTQPHEGWFTQHYGGAVNNGCARQPDGLKKPWQKKNTAKLDGIRAEIENLKLSKIDRAVALTSLMLALDRVDNSLGHFASYLREWPARAYKPLELKIPQIPELSSKHTVWRKDVYAAAAQPVDLCYYDPPYGSGNSAMPPSRVRYAAYYHLWTTVCLADQPAVFGKAKRRCDSADTTAASVFEDFRKNPAGEFLAILAVEELIKKTQAPHILLSYSPGQEEHNEALRRALRRQAKIKKTLRVDYKKNVMTQMTVTGTWQTAQPRHQEILISLEK